MSSNPTPSPGLYDKLLLRLGGVKKQLVIWCGLSAVPKKKTQMFHGTCILPISGQFFRYWLLYAMKSECK